MIDKNAKNRKLVQRTVNSMKMVAVLSLITNLYQVYGFVNAAGDVRQMLSIALGIAGTILIWQLAIQLQAGKKQSLYYWLMVIAVGMIRWIFVDAIFELNILSIILISMVAIFTMRMTVWVRSEVLT
jgi:predicted neutral ceramidase superfamily lipid hydrolase